MKKMRKQAVSLVLALCLLFALAACGEGEKPAQSDSPAATWQDQYDLGLRYLSEGNYQEAILAFTAAIEIDPKQADLYIGRAQAYVLSGETAENLAAAQADFDLVIQMDATKADAWLGLADVYIRMGNIDKALEVLTEGLSKTGNDSAIADKIAEMESGTVTDSVGNLRRKSSYDGSGSLLWYQTFTYTAGGEQATAASYDAAGNQTGYVELEYDANGNQTVGFFYRNADGELGKIEFEYDAAGNNTKAVWFMSDGQGREWPETYLYTYDDNGNCVKEEYYSAEGVLDFITHYEYNAAGHILQSNIFTADGTLYSYDLYEYDAEENLSAISSYFDFDGEMTMEHRIVYLYNEQGEEVGMEEYDGAGNLIQSTMFE